MNEEKLLALIRKNPWGKKVDKRISTLMEQAEQGDVDAMVMLGDCYNKGHYIEADQRRAFHYYLKAANRGSRDGELMVGLYYLDGVTGEKDELLGIGYIKKAADKGNARAQFLTGSFYEEGKLKAYGNEALTYFREAAQQGYAEAQISLGLKLGAEGTNKDREESVFWLLCAYMHGEDAYEESEKAKDIINDLINLGLSREHVDSLMEEIQINYLQYTKTI